MTLLQFIYYEHEVLLCTFIWIDTFTYFYNSLPLFYCYQQVGGIQEKSSLYSQITKGR